MKKFPHSFLWGAATSSYQVEGGNRNADWWHWEKKAGKIRSADACRHYELYEKDFDLAKRLNHNAHRLSIEWSRIEPIEGKFSRKEMEHYIKVIRALIRRDIEPVVTLHHFTNPLWLARRGGWANLMSVALFVRYCEFVVQALAPYVRYWVTVNEPTIYVTHAYIIGVWPPQKKSYAHATAVMENMVLGHVKAYCSIHGIYRRMRLAAPRVGIAQSVTAFVPSKKLMRNRFAAFLRSQVYNMGFLERIRRCHVVARKRMDFIGVNYYSRQVVDLKRLGLKNLAMDVGHSRDHPCEKNSLGWDVYPEGLYDVLMELKKYGIPILITENGICTARDTQRSRFIIEHLKYVHKAIRDGAGVFGYLYWSLLDNFEWDKGFAPRFGLIRVDYKTQKRTIRVSARKYAEICRTGYLR
jgi:beta-glucosidase